MTLNDCVAALRDVADRLSHTSSLRRRDPDHWLEERDELARTVRRIAGHLAAQSRSAARTAELAPERERDSRPRRRSGEIVVDGRRIMVEVRR